MSCVFDRVSIQYFIYVPWEDAICLKIVAVIQRIRNIGKWNRGCVVVSVYTSVDKSG